MKTLLLVHKDSNWKTLEERVKQQEKELGAKLAPIYGDNFTIDIKVINDTPPVNGRIVEITWFHEMHNLYPDYDAIGLLFSPTVGEKIGINKNYNGLYYQDQDKKFSFWVKTTEKATEINNRINRRKADKVPQFELIMEHELAGHGVTHDLGLKARDNVHAFAEGYDNTHYFFYNNLIDEHYEYLYKVWNTKANWMKRTLELMAQVLKKKVQVKDIQKDESFYYLEKKYFDRVTQSYLNPNSIYSTGYHMGTDYGTPSGTPIIAPTDGEIVKNSVGYYGGNTSVYKCRINGETKYFRFMHLSEFKPLGKYTAGSVIGFTGNTGYLTTGAHLHVDCWNYMPDISKITSKAAIERHTVNPHSLIQAMFMI